MKRLFYFLPLIGLLSCGDGEKSCKTNSIPINGFWSDSASESFTNCYAQFKQEGDSVFMTHFIEFNGAPFFETGKGVIKDDSLIYDVVVHHGIEGWSTAGTHKLKLVNPVTLEGSYADNKGNKGPLVFRKRN